MRQFFKSWWKIILIGAAVIILLIFFQQMKLLKSAEDVVTTTLKPVQTLFFQASQRIKDFFTYFEDRKSLEAENSELKNIIADLTVENLKLKRDIEDSQIISEELEYVTEHQYQAVTGKIIGRSSAGYSQVLLINKGESHGVQKGYPVIVNEGVLVGRIVDTNSQVARLLLLNSHGSEVSATIQNEKKSPGIVTGQYNITLKMELIPQDQKIETGQLVTTSGIEEFIPPEIIIGKIKEISKQGGELFQEATIEPVVDYQNLSIVTIILPIHE